MNIQCFYSWQSDTNDKFNKKLIEKAIKAAIKRLEKKYPNLLFKPIITRADDPKRAGTSNIVNTINSLIKNCDIFIADLSYVSQYDPFSDGEARATKGAINSNVATELGQAKALIGDERIIRVMNSTFGSPKTGIDLPFDIQQDRSPFEYSAAEGIEEAALEVELNKLSEFFYVAISNIVREHEAMQKERYKPFLTHKKWSELVDQHVPYISINSHEIKKQQLIAQVHTPKSATRIVGVSGIGKSRFVLESLRESPLSVLYYDVDSQNMDKIADRIIDLTAEGEAFTFIIDNTEADFHEKLSRIIKRSSSNSTLITIAPEEETTHRIFQTTMLLRLELEEGEQISSEILRHRFPNIDYIDLTKAINKIGYLPFLAVLLAKESAFNIHSLQDATSDNWLNNVLGKHAEDPNFRSTLRAIAAFGILGFDKDGGPKADLIIPSGITAFQKEVDKQAELVALDHLITPLHNTAKDQRYTTFKRVVQEYIRKGIIKKRGRFITIQPQYLSQKLCQEWWEEQLSLGNLETILNNLQGTPLLERLCEQLGKLTQSPISQQAIRLLYDSSGPFGNADVLLSEGGAAFFNALALVEPMTLANYLGRILYDLPLERLRNATTGRRSLVWGIEKLCRQKNTFERAAKFLFRLAAAENEEILNNATGQFCQLFQCRLAGIEADYSERLRVLQYGISQRDHRFDEIVIAACNRALNLVRGIKVYASDDETQTWKEYEPETNQDVWNYWHSIITILLEYATDLTHPSHLEAANIIINALAKIIEFGGAAVILPALSRLVDIHPQYYASIHGAAKNALYNYSYLPAEYTSQIEALIDRTLPTSLEDKIQSYVFDSVNFSDSKTMSKEQLQQRIESLVPEFIVHSELWQRISRNSYTAPNPFNVHDFFKAVAQQLSALPDDNQVDQILLYLLNALKTPIESEHYLTPLTGFFAGIRQQRFEKAITMMIQDSQLSHIIFKIAGALDYNESVLNLLLESVEKGELKPEGFYELTHNRFLARLPSSRVEEVTNRLKNLEVIGTWIALKLLWSRYDQDGQDRWWSLIRDLVMTETLWSVEFEGLSENQAIHSLTRIIQEATDKDAIERCIHQIVRFIDTPVQNTFRMKDYAYEPLKVLLQSHFEITWPIISEALSSEQVTNLFGLLGSSTDINYTTGGQLQNEGLLFKYGNEVTVFEWCRKQSINVLLRIARSLPIFHPKQPNTWHPFTKRFIDEFGDHNELLIKIEGRMKSFSSSGSVEDMYESYLVLFKDLENHPKINVLTWANRSIDFLPKLIKGERDFWEEWYL